jgi:hypothetical protein
MTPTSRAPERCPAPSSPHPNETHPRWRRRVTGIIATLSLAAGIVLASEAPAAEAVAAIGHGVGHTFSADGASWIGSYQLADGTMVFCLQAGKAAPIGHEYQITDARGLAWYSRDDSARLAFISRTWAGTTDPTTAAAAQLATWTITGLNGRPPAAYAARANGQAGQVMAQASDILSMANSAAGASRSVTAAVQLSVPDASTGQLTVKTDLLVDFLATGPIVVAPESHTGIVILAGAVFADGTDRMALGNAVESPITATGSAPVGEVSASVSFENLPYGSDFLIGQAGPAVQTVLLAGPGSASGSAAATVSVPSALPFQPQVVTQTSESIAETGAMISDELILSARVDADTLDGWGVYPSDEDPLTLLPIPVTVESTLLGPFAEPIVLAPEAPPNSPIVCEVEVVADAGPGSYRTEACELPGPGYYVWVERIVPGRTSLEAGGDRILPWQSDFGTASEITFVAPPVVPEEPDVIEDPDVPEVPVGEEPTEPARLAETGLPDSGVLLGTFLGGLLLIAGVLCRRCLPRTRSRPAAAHAQS